MIRYDRLKRIFDVVGSIALLILTLPIQAVIGVAVRRALGRPVLYRQVRPGRDGEPFALLKFRTMKTAEVGCELGTEEARLVPLGRKLRSMSLDELPTLWNVLVGDMSFVGPRPLLMSYLPLYSADQRRRHDVRPGITGLAQVSGRNNLSWERKFDLDVRYVEQRSLALDLKVLLKTAQTVASREGVTGKDGLVVEPFRPPGFHATQGTKPGIERRN